MILLLSNDVNLPTKRKMPEKDVYGGGGGGGGGGGWGGGGGGGILQKFKIFCRRVLM